MAYQKLIRYRGTAFTGVTLRQKMAITKDRKKIAWPIGFAVRSVLEIFGSIHYLSTVKSAYQIIHGGQMIGVENRILG